MSSLQELERVGLAARGELLHATVPRHANGRCDLGKGHQHEGTLVQVWMRDHEAVRDQLELAIEQQIEIEGARTPLRAGAIATVLSLDRLKCGEQRARRALRQ